MVGADTAVDSSVNHTPTLDNCAFVSLEFYYEAPGWSQDAGPGAGEDRGLVMGLVLRFNATSSAVGRRVVVAHHAARFVPCRAQAVPPCLTLDSQFALAAHALTTC